MEDPLFGPQPAAQVPGAALAPSVQRRLMTWDAGGNPTLAVVPLVTPAAMQDLYSAAAALPYEAPDPLAYDHRFHGMSCAEVIVRKQLERAARSGENPEPVMDRLMGKPKQKTESVRVTLTYEESLKLIAQKVAAGMATPPRVVEGEIVG